MIQTNPTDPALWVDTHGDYLYRFALLRFGDPDAAADLVQDTLLSALRTRDSFSGRSSERTWLVGILKHKIIDRRRKLGRLHEVLDGDAVDRALDGQFDHRRHWKTLPAPWPEDPGRTMESSEFWAVLGRCLTGLPALLRESFMMRELDQRETSQICQDLEITPTNLAARLHRARLLLRDCLERRWFSEGGQRGCPKFSGARSAEP
jgi:RNA polymerase sigma-70 factor (ECF subfamily)